MCKGTALSRAGLIAFAIVLVLVGCGVGFMVGYFVRELHKSDLEVGMQQANERVAERLLDVIKARNIRKYLKSVLDI